MFERDPLKTLAEQPPRMRWAAVIVVRERAPALAYRFDMLEVAAFGRITSERLPFQRRLFGGELDCDIGAAGVGELVRAGMAAGEIVGGELMDRQDIAELRSERISRVVVLVRALEGRNP
jgi:hypothetical protein